MKNKKIAIVILIVGILLIASGSALGIYTYVSENKEKTRKYEKNILDKYEEFKIKADSFNEVRTTYYNEVAKNLYPESVKEEYANWVTVLKNYTESIEQVEKSSDVLKQECVNKYHSNDDVKNKCQAFVIAYETVMNYYTKDIESFNETIQTYVANNGNDEKIQSYESKYSYTDINSDGKFIGKN